LTSTCAGSRGEWAVVLAGSLMGPHMYHGNRLGSARFARLDSRPYHAGARARRVKLGSLPD